MYSTDKPKSSPAFGQQAPVTGVPVTHQGPAPFHVHQPGGGNGRWSTGLCDCFSDVPNCCITFWCPCITFGHIAEIVDEGATPGGVSGTLYGLLALVTGCACCYSCFYRSKMRNRYSLEEHPCADCCVHFWCEGCALCQEYRELKNRGFDMSIGWHENMQRMQSGGGQLPTAPVVETQMQR